MARARLRELGITVGRLPTGPLNATELERIRTWIANGALNN